MSHTSARNLSTRIGSILNILGKNYFVGDIIRDLLNISTVHVAILMLKYIYIYFPFHINIFFYFK